MNSVFACISTGLHSLYSLRSQSLQTILYFHVSLVVSLVFINLPLFLHKVLYLYVHVSPLVSIVSLVSLCLSLYVLKFAHNIILVFTVGMDNYSINCENREQYNRIVIIFLLLSNRKLQ